MVCLHNAERGDEMSDAVRQPVIGPVEVSG